MAKSLRHALFILMCTLSQCPAAAPPEIKSGDGLPQILNAYRDKRVSLRLSGGQELTGILRESSASLVRLEAITGREFFDAVVVITSIEAVIVRARGE